MIRCQVGVDHGSLDVRVTEKLLNGGEVDAFHDQVRCESVAETVDLGDVIQIGLASNTDQVLAQFSL